MNKRKIITLVLALVSFGLVQAQQGNYPQNQNAGKTPEERATMRSQKLTEQLGLSADQQKSACAFFLSHVTQQDDDKLKCQGDHEAMKSVRQKKALTFEANISSFRTPEQKTKYDELQKEEQAKWQQNGDHQGKRK